MIAGRDVQAGGSWLGVSEQGRLTVVTNIRSAEKADALKLSRGALVRDWLTDAKVPPVDALAGYNPFNLLLVDRTDAVLCFNRPAPQRISLDKGIHGLSNGHHGEPWPRRMAVETALERWIGVDDNPESLFALLRDERVTDDQGLPIFIRGEAYGTRCSTVVLVDHDGRGQIIEHRFDASGSDTGRTDVAFRWP